MKKFFVILLLLATLATMCACGESSEKMFWEQEPLKTVSPRGFAGSSLYKVVLLEDSSVVVVVNNGNGVDTAIVLVAAHATDIQEDEYGGVIVVGDNLNIYELNRFSWIEFLD